MSDLKRCPFCGGEAELYESEAYNLKTETKEKNIRWFVICEQCTALTCGALKEKAIEAWNRRVTERAKQQWKSCSN